MRLLKKIWSFLATLTGIVKRKKMLVYYFAAFEPIWGQRKKRDFHSVPPPPSKHFPGIFMPEAVSANCYCALTQLCKQTLNNFLRACFVDVAG